MCKTRSRVPELHTVFFLIVKSLSYTEELGCRLQETFKSTCPTRLGTRIDPSFPYRTLHAHLQCKQTPCACKPNELMISDLCHQRLRIYSPTLTFPVHHKADIVYMTLHLLPPVGSPGFCDFSISAIICSNAFPTLIFNRALASVKLQLNSSANLLPSSAWTWRWSAFRSLLFPTMTKGTQSAPCQQVSLMCRSDGGFGSECLPGD